MDITKGWRIEEQLDFRQKEIIIILARSANIHMYDESGFDIHENQYTSYHSTLGLIGASMHLMNVWKEHFAKVTYEEVMWALKNKVQDG